MNVLSREVQAYLLEHFAEGVPLTKIVRMSGVSPNTARRYLARFGQALAAFHDQNIKNVKSKRIQADENWGFVYAKREKNVYRGDGSKAPAEVGAYWQWLGMDQETKLAISWAVGDRTHLTATQFFMDMRMRVIGCPLIMSDAHNAYPDAIQRAFADDADHATVEKEIQTWYDLKTGDGGTKKFKITKLARTRRPIDLSKVTISHIERFNLSNRHFNPRLARRCVTFSKRLANHIHAQAIFIVYFNFVRVHNAFRGGPMRHWTPAMAAGITNKVWTYNDLLDEIDLYWAVRGEGSPLAVLESQARRTYTPLKAGEVSDRRYYVMLSPRKREAKVHVGTCRNCRHGMGRLDGVGTNLWYHFHTEAAAKRCAETLAPLQHSVCSICILGKYPGNSIRQANNHRRNRS